MKIHKLIIISGILFSFGWVVKNPDKEKESMPEISAVEYDTAATTAQQIWDESSFKAELSLEVFSLAISGYNKYGVFNEGIISIVDYSKPSSEKRFYVIDLAKKTLLFHTLIAHGKNTGENSATYFSNVSASLKSSLGFFKTAETYAGKHGYSLRVDGLEKGINDNARGRAIVIHGAEYVSQDFVKNQGRLGRSWGCPALPVLETKDIIDAIPNGTCLFIYGNNESYLKESTFINP